MSCRPDSEAVIAGARRRRSKRGLMRWAVGTSSSLRPVTFPRPRRLPHDLHSHRQSRQRGRFLGAHFVEEGVEAVEGAAVAAEVEGVGEGLAAGEGNAGQSAADGSDVVDEAEAPAALPAVGLVGGLLDRRDQPRDAELFGDPVVDAGGLHGLGSGRAGEAQNLQEVIEVAEGEEVAGEGLVHA